jgi:membrane protein implicated in regulation of membrane protease activity
MDAWVLWILLAVALAIGEIATMGFFLAPFAAGALLGALAAAVGAGDVVSAIVALVTATVLFAFVRPVARRHLYLPAPVRTGTAALVGTRAIVVERIANDEGTGIVKLAGEAWTARAYDEDEVIAEGRRVQVIEIRGATALVSQEEVQP